MQRVAGDQRRVVAQTPILQYHGPGSGQARISIAQGAARVIRRAGEEIARVGKLILTDSGVERWIVRVAKVWMTLFGLWVGWQVIRAIGEGHL